MELTNITPIIGGAIIIIAGLLSCFVIPFLKAKIGTERGKQILDGFELLKRTVMTFVDSAEQLGLVNGWHGDEKLSYVLKLLEKEGYIVDETLRAYVEAAVHYLNDEY